MTTRVIPPAVVDRVAQILPRLGSNHHGEVVATAAAVIRVLGNAGHDLHDLVAAFRKGAIELPPPKEPDKLNQFDVSADWCRQHECDTRLRARDREFLKSMARWFTQGKPPSASQEAWLNDIHRRIEG
jgi:hypothetical protein